MLIPGVPWFAAALIAFAVAIIYLRVWPRPVNAAHAQRRPFMLQWILRWAHSIVWWLLGLFCALHYVADQIPSSVFALMAWAALALYGIFMASVVYDRRLRREN
jgi:hypothetical protein